MVRVSCNACLRRLQLPRDGGESGHERIVPFLGNSAAFFHDEFQPPFYSGNAPAEHNYHQQNQTDQHQDVEPRRLIKEWLLHHGNFSDVFIPGLPRIMSAHKKTIIAGRQVLIERATRPCCGPIAVIAVQLVAELQLRRIRQADGVKLHLECAGSWR